MTSRQAKAKLKELGIMGRFRRLKKELELRVDPECFPLVDQHLAALKDSGFFMRLFGQCDPSNMIPRSPGQMLRCDSCTLTASIHR